MHATQRRTAPFTARTDPPHPAPLPSGEREKPPLQQKNGSEVDSAVGRVSAAATRQCAVGKREAVSLIHPTKIQNSQPTRMRGGFLRLPFCREPELLRGRRRAPLTRSRDVRFHVNATQRRTAPFTAPTDTPHPVPLPNGEREKPPLQQKNGALRLTPDHSGCVCASTTASATILTMRRTEAIGVSTCTGFATPIRTGPTVTPSELETRSKL